MTAPIRRQELDRSALDADPSQPILYAPAGDLVKIAQLDRVADAKAYQRSGESCSGSLGTTSVRDIFQNYIKKWMRKMRARQLLLTETSIRLWRGFEPWPVRRLTVFCSRFVKWRLCIPIASCPMANYLGVSS